MKEIPELYAIAKQITLDAGLPYTDPRTLETTQPMKNNKIPKWLLFDQIHVDVNIKSDMPEADRRKLRKALNSQPFKNELKAAVQFFGASPTTEKPPQIKVAITR